MSRNSPQTDRCLCCGRLGPRGETRPPALPAGVHALLAPEHRRLHVRAAVCLDVSRRTPRTPIPDVNGTPAKVNVKTTPSFNTERRGYPFTSVHSGPPQVSTAQPEAGPGPGGRTLAARTPTEEPRPEVGQHGRSREVSHKVNVQESPGLLTRENQFQPWLQPLRNTKFQENTVEGESAG